MNHTSTVGSEAVARSEPAWRRLIGFPLVALLLSLVALKLFGFLAGLLGKTVASGPSGVDPLVSAVLMALASILAVKLAIRRLGAEPRDDLPFDRRARDLGTGILFAALLMSAVVGISALLGGYRVSGWGGSTSLLWLLLVAGLKAGFVEEVMFRGVIFRFLEEFAGSWIALVLSALLFGFVHHRNPDATIFTSLAIALQAGTLMAGAYMLTRNLWFAVGLHGGWNVTQGYLWDVPVSGIPVDGLLDAHPAGNPLISGGAFGLEGSLIATVVVSAAGLWLIAKAARIGRVVQPWWVRRRAGVAMPASTGPLSPRLAVSNEFRGTR